MQLTSTDIDGSGGNGDVIRIPDGQVSVDGNAMFDDNAFDYVCETCKEHRGEPFVCHGEDAVWHDDVALMEAFVHKTGLDTQAVKMMEKFGLIYTYGGDELFVSMNRMPMFLMSGMAQMHKKNQELEARLAAIGG